MKRYASILLSASIVLSASAASPMASGHWVKFRVNESGAYQFTEAELRDLGFSDPAKVRVYGFAPTLLLTHDTDKIPSDLSAIPSVYENGKIAFYAKDNVDYNAEFWNTGASPDGLDHNRLSSTNGAIYFLSDQGEAPILPQIQAEQPSGQELTSHDCVIFHEQDLTNPGSAGVVFGGEMLSSRSAQVPFTVTLADIASGTGRMLHQSLMLNSSSSNNNLTVLYPEGWTSEDIGHNGTGAYMSGSNHVVFGMARRNQSLTIPIKEEPTDYELVFTPNPAIGSGFSRGYIDYWALIYDRQNNLAGQSQLTMHFPKSATFGFVLTGMDGDGWHVWDVTSPVQIKECEMVPSESGDFVGNYATGSSTAPAAVIAFNTEANLPTPEIVGTVANQDLQSMATPDMVIVAAPLLIDVAEEAAQVHRTLQGLDVAVVSQEDIFNEFGSGNVSPEAVRLFLRHLWLQDPNKLKSVMLVGPATVDNAKNVNPGSPSVVTFQQESQKQCEKTTSNFFSDAFFGHLGELKAVTSTDKLPVFRLLKTPQTISVGRLPWSDPATIRGYIAKVEDYLKNSPMVPTMANIITSSDLTKSSGDDHHYSDAENTIAPYGDKLDGDVTVTRLHSNFYSAANNTMTRRWLRSILGRGTDLMVYFGHGASNQIGGSVSATDYLLDLAKADELNNDGNHTFGFFGSCNIAQYDAKSQTLATQLVGNPHGGLIGLVACCREGYVQENPKVGKAFVEQFANAADGTYIGDAFRLALDKFDTSGASAENFSNYHCYGYTGDPMLPLRRATNTMALDPIEAIYPGVANTISGTITDADGNPDTSFSGTATITIYDVPQTLLNKITTDTTAASMIMDHTPLLQVPAAIVNGKFTAEFNGPAPSANGTLRITAYAASADGLSRAITSAKEVAVTEAPAYATPIIYSGSAEITDFCAQGADIETSLVGRILLHAEISAPDGLNIGTAGFAPARLSIDGKSRSDAPRALRFVSPGIYQLDYYTSEMGDGRHTAQLDIIGLDGEVVSRTIEFSTNSVASATAEVTTTDEGEIHVNFIVSNIDKSIVCVENLSGTMIRRIETTEQSVNITDLPSGVYRVYTQHESKSTHTSSPKTIVTI